MDGRAVLGDVGEEERLAAGAGAEVEDGLGGLGLEEEPDELAALILRLEETALVGGETEDVGAAREDDSEGGVLGTAGTGQGGEKGFVDGGVLDAEADGAGRVDRVGEGGGVRWKLLDEDALQPVGKGGAVGKARERRVGVGDEGVEEGRGIGILPAGEVKEGGEAAAPESDAEDGLSGSASLLGGEIGMGAEEAIEGALGGSAREDGRDRRQLFT
ncbi:MAG TPA: hypothetical protein VIG99_28200, partial [Myxococcaceae bacterium]